MPNKDESTHKFGVNKSDEEWFHELGAEAYYVLREKGTERPFINHYYKLNDQGVYCCRGCETPLFLSEAKYDSGSGWPAFYAALDPSKILEKRDTTHGMIRTEVMCAHCGGHLGHVFDDGPQPTGMRYCINSASLHFVKAESKK